MPATVADSAAQLPHPVPVEPTARILLYAIRRMAIGGLDDAHAANVLMGQLGMNYRRPLIILRALMLETSRTSERSISIAPCCCRRMTGDEAAFMQAIEAAAPRPEIARTHMTRLTGTLDCWLAVSSAQALGQAFEDLGRPVTL